MELGVKLTKVKKKKMQFIIPKAKDAFNMAQFLLTSSAHLLPEIRPIYPRGPRSK